MKKKRKNRHALTRTDTLWVRFEKRPFFSKNADFYALRKENRKENAKIKSVTYRYLPADKTDVPPISNIAQRNNCMKLDINELKNYPEKLNKEQFRTVCHISKRTALYLLQSGMVRAENTGKKTHSWLISKTDILNFAKEYEKNPFKFQPPDNWYVYKKPTVPEIVIRAVPPGSEFAASTAIYYRNTLQNEPDVLGVRDISRITGYGAGAVTGWIRKGELKVHYAHINRYYVPKLFLFNFLCGDYYNSIAKKNVLHLKAVREIYDAVFCGTVSPTAITDEADHVK